MDTESVDMVWMQNLRIQFGSEHSGSDARVAITRNQLPASYDTQTHTHGGTEITPSASNAVTRKINHPTTHNSYVYTG